MHFVESPEQHERTIRDGIVMASGGPSSSLPPLGVPQTEPLVTVPGPTWPKTGLISANTKINGLICRLKSQDKRGSLLEGVLSSSLMQILDFSFDGGTGHVTKWH